MIRYVPTSGSEVADTLTRALWALSRPPHVRGTKDTVAMFAPDTMTDGSVWLKVHTDFSVRVHEAAVLGDIAGILQPWIDAEALPASVIADLEAVIDGHKGQRLTVWDAFPQLFRDQSKTREELITLGLIVPPEMP